ncbi:MAG: PAS domain-containing protein [Tepidisphaeraceae bacterium]
MNGTDESLAILNVLCSADGVVLQQSPPKLLDDDADTDTPKPTDDWRSRTDALDAVGKPLVKTWWFDHLDCDQRELQQVLRTAGKGKHSRVRVWLRVTEHELVRAELTATPMVDAKGEVQHLFIRTEPTSSLQRRREPPRAGQVAEPTSKLARTEATPHAAPPPDLLEQRLPVPLIRLDLAGGTVLAVNDAFADLLGHGDRSRCTKLPLTELVHPQDRSIVSEALANLHAATRTGGFESTIDRTIEARLLDSGGNGTYARLLLFADPSRLSDTTALAVVRDVGADRLMLALMQRADQQTQAAHAHELKLDRLERLLGNAPVGLALFDGSQPIEVNATLRRMVGTPAVEAKPAKRKRRRPAEAAADPLQTLGQLAAEAIAAKSPARRELEIDSASLLASVIPLEGTLAAAVVVDPDALDIKSDPLDDTTFDALLATSLVGAGIIDADSKLVRASDQLRKTLSLAPSANLTWLDIVAPPSRSDGESMLAQAQRGTPASRDRMTLLSADARLVPVAVSLHPLGEGGPALLLVDDCTDTERAIELHRTRHDRLNELLSQHPTPRLAVSRDTLAVLSANAAAGQLLGTGVDRLVGQSLETLFTALAPTLLGSLRDAVKNGRGFKVDSTTITPSLIVDFSVVPTGPNDDVDVVLVDRTNERRTEQAHRSAEARLATLASAAKAGIVEWDIVEGHIRATPAALQLLSAEPTETLSTEVLFRKVQEDDRGTLERALFDAMEVDGPGTLDLPVRAGQRDIRLAGRIEFDDDRGQKFPARATLAVFSRAGEVAQQRAFEKLDTLAAELANTIELRDDEIESLKEVVASRDADLAARNADLEARHKTIEQHEARIAELTKQLAELEAKLAATGEQLSQRDYNARLRTAELNAVMEAVHGSLRLQSDGPLRANSSAASLFGKFASQAFEDIGAWVKRASIADAAGKPIDPAEHPIAHAKSGRAATSILQSKPSRDADATHLRTTAVPVHLNGSVVGIVSVDTDLTEQRRLEAQASQLQTDAERFFDNASLGVARVTNDGRLADANRQLAIILGVSREELAGKALTSIVLDDDASTLNSRLKEITTGAASSASCDVRLRGRDGKTVESIVTFVPRGTGEALAIVQDTSDLYALRRTLQTAQAELESTQARIDAIRKSSSDGFVLLATDGKEVEGNDVARRLAGGTALHELSFVDATGKPIPGGRLPWNATNLTASIEMKPANSEALAAYSATRLAGGQVLVTIRDLSQRVALREELQKAQARVVEAHTLMESRLAEQSERLTSALRQLRGPAQSILAPAKALAADPRLPSDLRDASSSLLDTASLQARLVDALPDPAKLVRTLGRSDREAVDVHALLRDAIRLAAEAAADRGVKIELEPRAARSRIAVDPSATRHALWTMLAEAVRLAPANSIVGVSTEDATPTAAGGRVRLTIEHRTAPGFSVGTSLDASIARVLLESERASVDVVAAPGDVVRSRVEFDIASDTEASHMPSTSAPAATRQLRVLLVEDHESTARVISRQLLRLSCQVDIARSIGQADAMLDKGEKYGLIVSDLTLPDGSATDFMARAASKYNLPGVALRGYGSTDDPQALRASGFVDLLMKPVDLNALSAAIQKIGPA